MSAEIFGFRGGPTYRGASPVEQFDAAMAAPMSLTSTFFDQAKGGILESFGLGTAVRGAQLPDAAPTAPGLALTRPDGSVLTLPDTPNMRRRQTVQGVQVPRETPQQFDQRRTDAGAISEDAYKSSPYFRANIPWDSGMTEDRAAALAMMDDAKKVREFYAEKRPITAFIGNLAGQALDPVNYVPIAGPSVRAAAAARFGRIGGAAVAGALDAAGNTALAAVTTQDTRATYGDDVSWQSTVSQIATAALIGGAFGTIGGAFGARSDARARRLAEERLATLKTTQEARIALNEGIDALAKGEDVSLSPNAVQPMTRVAEEISARPPVMVAEPPVPDGLVRVYHSGSAGEGETGRWVSTNRQYASDYRPDLPLFYTDLPASDPRINNPDYADQGVKQGFTFNFEMTPEEAARLKQVDRIPTDLVATSAESRPLSAAELAPGVGDSSLNRTASWVIREKATGKAVMETFNPKLVERVNTAKYEAVPIGQYLGEINGKPKRAVDTSPPRPEPIPAGRAQAESRIAKPDDYKALAAQYGIDPQNGSFTEEGDIAQLAVEGRLTEDDAVVLADAQSTFEDGAAYGEALKSVASCLI